jgi:hypothetical protein
MNDHTSNYTYERLANHDEAFRISLLLLINDPSYQLLPLRQATTIYQSICSSNYFLMLRGHTAFGVILWMEISDTVKTDCMQKDRSPFVHELSERGDALYCTGLSATKPGLVLPLWRHLTQAHAHRDILVKRHFQRGKLKIQPIALVRNQKRVRLPSGSVPRNGQ